MDAEGKRLRQVQAECIRMKMDQLKEEIKLRQEILELEVKKKMMEIESGESSSSDKAAELYDLCNSAEAVYNKTDRETCPMSLESPHSSELFSSWASQGQNSSEQFESPGMSLVRPMNEHNEHYYNDMLTSDVGPRGQLPFMTSSTLSGQPVMSGPPVTLTSSTLSGQPLMSGPSVTMSSYVSGQPMLPGPPVTVGSSALSGPPVTVGSSVMSGPPVTVGSSVSWGPPVMSGPPVSVTMGSSVLSGPPVMSSQPVTVGSSVSWGPPVMSGPPVSVTMGSSVLSGPPVMSGPSVTMSSSMLGQPVLPGPPMTVGSSVLSGPPVMSGPPVSVTVGSSVSWGPPVMSGPPVTMGSSILSQPVLSGPPVMSSQPVTVGSSVLWGPPVMSGPPVSVTMGSSVLSGPPVMSGPSVTMSSSMLGQPVLPGPPMTVGSSVLSGPPLTVGSSMLSGPPVMSGPPVTVGSTMLSGPPVMSGPPVTVGSSMLPGPPVMSGPPVTMGSSVSGQPVMPGPPVTIGSSLLSGQPVMPGPPVTGGSSVSGPPVISDCVPNPPMSAFTFPQSPVYNASHYNFGDQIVSGLIEAQKQVAATISAGFNLPRPQLQSFTGDPKDYFRFIKNFEASLGNVTDMRLKLNYLIQYCEDDAKRAVRDCAILNPEVGYFRALEILQQTYGRPHVISHSYIDELVNGPALKPNDFRGLGKLALQMQQCEITLNQLGYSADMNNSENLLRIARRSPLHLRAKWAERADSYIQMGLEPKFTQLCDFIQNRARVASSVYGKDLEKPKDMMGPKKVNTGVSSRQSGKTFATRVDGNKNSLSAGGANKGSSNKFAPKHLLPCQMCGGNHSVWECQSFIKKSVDERHMFMRKNGLCNNCAQPGHFGKGCMLHGACTHCKGKHNTLLHGERKTQTQSSNPGNHASSQSGGSSGSQGSQPLHSGTANLTTVSQGPSTSVNEPSEDTSEKGGTYATSSVSPNGASQVNLKVLPVRVVSGDSCYVTYAMLDDCSDVSLCTDRLVESLGLKGASREYHLTTVNGEGKHQGKEVSLVIESLDEQEQLHIEKAWTVKTIQVSADNVPRKSDIHGYSHLEGLEFPEISCQNIDLLIGANVPEAFWNLGDRRGKKKEPYAVKTPLGWTLIGPVGRQSEHSSFHVNFTSSRSKDMDIQKSLQRLWNMDFPEASFSTEPTLSIQDKQALHIMNTTVKKQTSGHYQLSLPWKKHPPDLHNNRPMAEKRLQGLKRRLERDTPLSADDVIVWQRWLQDLDHISQIKIPRCFTPLKLQPPYRLQLHNFSDASETGYGCVSYIRAVDANGCPHVTLVMGKSRVTPLKVITIPRLELTAAAVAVKQDKMIRKELDLELEPSVFWTDSTSVLQYLANDDRRFQTFVANRVSLIHENTSRDQWRHVNTSLNPADHASRGLGFTEPQKMDQWLQGPAFLWKPEDQWPEMIKIPGLSEDDKEVKKSAKVYMTSQEDTAKTDHPMEYLIQRKSTWMGLLKSVAWLLRLKTILRHRAGHMVNTPSAGQTLKLKEVRQAEATILKFIQIQEFPEEISCLSTIQENETLRIKTSSSLKKLSPVLVDGILRVGGRLERASLEYEEKHPAILPKRGQVTDLIVRHFHEVEGHSGANHVLTRIRMKYWIVNGLAAVRRIIGKCIFCRKRAARLGQQIMAPLPENRLRYDEAPFSYTGVDYFGPVFVKSGRSLHKRYGCIFTCLSCRAVHIEIAHSLETDSFLCALMRFISRRGKPKEISSDNGTNFKGGDKELRDAIKQWNSKRISDFMLQRNIEWNYNPPTASHMGGAWERLIRSIRHVLKAVLDEQRITDESLVTAIAEVEKILNDRPLTSVENQPDDLRPLTPNQVLLLRSNSSLPPGLFSKEDCYGKRRWRQAQYLANLFWRRWMREYLPSLQARQKWTSQRRNFAVNDLVLIGGDNVP